MNAKEIMLELDKRFRHKESKQKWVVGESFPIEPHHKHSTTYLSYTPKKQWVLRKESSYDYGLQIEPEYNIKHLTQEQVIKQFIESGMEY